ncbi:hypothetical protein JAAARDRAFT_201114 [Jaapia argillacea MUCL 33604]|uniref:Uncharacterized protein n=1 Tax=Jaapia argillacea MUCL 33604 TaxID=933084 RepID=A0A067P2I8_9AGAM|nr:hypothetical protein JAAARDRAFT_201114 [Jaapia argillacea MUCL 33604]
MGQDLILPISACLPPPQNPPPAPAPPAPTPPPHPPSPAPAPQHHDPLIEESEDELLLQHGDHLPGLAEAQEHFGEPRTFHEAMQRPEEERDKWFKAASEEIQSLIDNGTFELVCLPPGS